MRKAVLFLFFLPFLLVSVSGCIFVLGGAAGALGAYGLSRDTIEGATDVPYENLWSSALVISRARGMIKQEDSLQGVIELEAESSKIWIRLIRVTQYTTKLRISARKYHFPNLALAQDLYVRILEQGK